jgi:hypothetical protein
MLMQFRSHGDREPRRRTNVLEFLKDNIGKTQLIKKFIKVEAFPAKNFPETKEIPGENIKVEASPTKNSPETKVMPGENIKVEASPTKNFPETKEIPGKSIKKIVVPVITISLQVKLVLLKKIPPMLDQVAQVSFNLLNNPMHFMKLNLHLLLTVIDMPETPPPVESLQPDSEQPESSGKW